MSLPTGARLGPYEILSPLLPLPAGEGWGEGTPGLTSAPAATAGRVSRSERPAAVRVSGGCLSSNPLTLPLSPEGEREMLFFPLSPEGEREMPFFSLSLWGGCAQ
jgi:hypothetical protein